MNFPSIDKFRHVIKSVERKVRFTGLDDDNYPIYDNSIELPVCKLTGTVKLHGTNAAIEFKDGEQIARRRKGVLTPKESHYGFSAFAKDKRKYFEHLHELLGGGDCTIYGEWVGRGVLKGCAIHELEPAFYVFAIRRDEKWLPITEYDHIQYNQDRIFNIAQFPTFEITIDFNAPKASVGLLEELTTQVEDRCPVAAHFGSEGVGEGIVWTFDDPKYNSSEFWFKVKGDKHKTATTKEKVEVDVEKVNSIREFVDVVLTEARLTQGLEEIKELSKKHTGAYLKWVVNDVLKEETDRLEASGLEKSEITKACSNRARDWFFEYLTEL